MELNKFSNYSKTFKQNSIDDSWGNSQLFEQKRIFKLSKLSIKCVIQETMKIREYNNDGVIIWKINENLLQNMKIAKCDDEFTSPIFEIADTLWNLSCYPSGFEMENKGYFGLYL